MYDRVKKKCKTQLMGETKCMLLERLSEHRQATNNPLHVNALAAIPSYFNFALATLSHTWILSHLNYNTHSAHPVVKHEKLPRRNNPRNCTLTSEIFTLIVLYTHYLSNILHISMVDWLNTTQDVGKTREEM